MSPDTNDKNRIRKDKNRGEWEGEANWKLEEHVKLPRERKTGRLPAVSKHGKPDSESSLTNRQAPVQRPLTSP